MANRLSEEMRDLPSMNATKAPRQVCAARVKRGKTFQAAMASCWNELETMDEDGSDMRTASAT